MFDNNVKETFRVGYVATKKLGNAVKRNRAKRIMRELIRKNISKHSQYNYFYVLIAKKTIFDTSLQNLENEFVKLLLKK